VRLQVEDSGSIRSVAVAIDDADATVADLARELSLDEASALIFDGVVHFPDTPLSEVQLVNGSLVGALGANVRGRTGLGYQWVGITGGHGAGDVRNLDTVGNVVVGRSELAELRIENPSVSSTHAVVERQSEDSYSVVDLESLNGTWVSGRSISKQTRIDDAASIRVGSSTLSLRPVDRSDQPLGVTPAHSGDNGTVLFNRPPRTPVPPMAKPIVLPDRPAERIAPALAIASLIAPLIFAGVMVAVLGSWRYALFGLLSPVMAISNWVSGRRRVAREREGDIRTHRESISSLKRELAEAIAVERKRRATIGPDLLEIRRRVELPSTRLWERRLADDDALHVRVGVGTITFEPLTEIRGDTVAADVSELVEAHRPLADVELLADLSDGPIGIVGHRTLRDASARSCMLQVATHHGPADQRIAVLTTPDRIDQWDWAHWLPHNRSSSEAALILAGDSAGVFASDVLASLDEQSGRQDVTLHPGWLFVVDDVELLHRRSSPLRQLLNRPEANLHGIVLADTADQLPASASTVVQILTVDGEFELTVPSEPDHLEQGIADLAPIAVANDIARQMARFEDPELPTPAGDVPAIVRAADVFGSQLTSDDIARRWHLSTRSDKLITPIGVGEHGLVSIDMVGDGPHALIGGTTGAGKSELLRTLIVGLAANYDPDDLVFVLVDYKGGSAFDACANLPHVVGLVTDLDAHLAERALLSLEAELHHREATLRSAGAKDISDYRAGGSPEGPLPRLVVLIDEFATLRAELPDFIAALIGIAQRGRSLGVHLVLATQRPTGAVDANIKANTNLRIALRMQDSPDSLDVIDDKAAAELSRTTPGRAYIRTGKGQLAIVQSGFLSGPAGEEIAPVRVAAIPVGSGQGPEFASGFAEDGPTELESIVGAIRDTDRRGAEPRRPWLPELPATVELSTLVDVDVDVSSNGADGPLLRIALGDEPSRQRRVMRSWSPVDAGLVVVGQLGSGVTTTLRSIIADLGTSPSTRATWIFPVDHGAGGLAGIDRYPHVAPVIAANDEARQARLFSLLSEALDARRQQSPEEVATLPLMLIVIDGMASFVETNDLGSGAAQTELWERIVRDGPAVGIVTVVGATRRSDIPRSTWALAAERVLLEQSDSTAFADIGVRPAALPEFVPGRALWGSDAMVVQMIDWEPSVEPDQCVVLEPLPDVAPLDTEISRTALVGVDTQVEPNLIVPIGIDDVTRRVTQLIVRAGEHATIAGPAGSGRTSALVLIAQQLRAEHEELVLVGVAPAAVGDLFAAGVFDAHGTIEGLSHVLSMAASDSRRWVIVVDDAERIDAEDGPLVDLAKNAPPNVTIVASVRSATARQAYGHWTRFVRASGTGVILQPDPAVDGDLLGVRLPRHERLPAVPGRGYLVGAGEAHVIQLCY